MHFTIGTLYSFFQRIGRIDCIITKLWDGLVRKCWLWTHQFRWIDVVNAWFLFMEIVNFFGIFRKIVQHSQTRFQLYLIDEPHCRCFFLLWIWNWLTLKVPQGFWSHNKPSVVFYMKIHTLLLRRFISQLVD